MHANLFATSIVMDLSSWLLSYAVHSTVLLGVVWLIARRLGERRLLLQDAMWKFAVVAGLVTATLQVGLHHDPVAGELVLSPSQPEAAQPALAGLAELTSTSDALDIAPDPLPPLEGLVLETASEDTAAVASTSPASDRGTWLALALVAWLSIACWNLIRLLRAWFSLRCLLEPRRELDDPHLRRVLRSLLEAAGSRRSIRLTCCDSILVPIAFGHRRAEICVPPAAAELEPGQQVGILAHELAHILRRDPVWVVLARAIEAVLFFQPLNRIARERREHLSELLADDWAVMLTGDRRGLAGCLAVVAGWVAGGRQSVLAPGMAGARGGLRRRVMRILGAAPGRTNVRWRWALPLGAAAAVAIALTAPRISVAAQPRDVDDSSTREDMALLWSADDEPVAHTWRSDQRVVIATAAAFHPHPDRTRDSEWEDDEEAEQAERRRVRRRKKVEPEREHPHRTLQDYSRTLRDFGWSDEAIEQQIEALEQLERLSGDEVAHETTKQQLKALKKYEKWAKKQGQVSRRDIERIVERQRRAQQRAHKEMQRRQAQWQKMQRKHQSEARQRARHAEALGRQLEARSRARERGLGHGHAGPHEHKAKKHKHKHKAKGRAYHYEYQDAAPRKKVYRHPASGVVVIIGGEADTRVDDACEDPPKASRAPKAPKAPSSTELRDERRRLNAERRRLNDERRELNEERRELVRQKRRLGRKRSTAKR